MSLVYLQLLVQNHLKTYNSGNDVDPDLFKWIGERDNTFGRVSMRTIFCAVLISLWLGACSQGPESGVKYHFASKDEYLKYYLPLQKDHGGVKKWVPAEDPDCNGGKRMTLNDGFQVIFCPADGNEDLFKLSG